MIGVQVSDDDGGVTTGSVAVGQTLTLCRMYSTGALAAATASGGCQTGAGPLVLPSINPVTLCVSLYTGAIAWTPAGSCPAGQRPHVVPTSGPLPFCHNTYTTRMRFSPTGVCSTGERAGVIPG
jgi:hypothetical protein